MPLSNWNGNRFESLTENWWLVLKNWRRVFCEKRWLFEEKTVSLHGGSQDLLLSFENRKTGHNYHLLHAITTVRESYHYSERKLSLQWEKAITAVIGSFHSSDRLTICAWLYPNRPLPVPQQVIVCTATSHFLRLSFNEQLTVIGKESDEETFPITETRLKKQKNVCRYRWADACT